MNFVLAGGGGRGSREGRRSQDQIQCLVMAKLTGQEKKNYKSVALSKDLLPPDSYSFYLVLPCSTSSQKRKSLRINEEKLKSVITHWGEGENPNKF